jgi:hypothetical protein
MRAGAYLRKHVIITLLCIAAFVLVIIALSVAIPSTFERKPELTVVHLQSELDLSEQQTADIRRILDDAAVQERILRQQGYEKIVGVLTPAQRNRFASFREKSLIGPSASFINWLLMLICAETFFVLLRSRELNIMFKSPDQRTLREKQEVKRGLLRSVTLEGVFFVPASVLLVFIAIRPLMFALPYTAAISHSDEAQMGMYGFLCIASYGFPFLTLRRMVVVMAVGLIKEVAHAGLPQSESKLQRKARA